MLERPDSFVLRLVLEGVATLEEVETYYSFTDALSLTDLMLAKVEVERATLARDKK